MQAGPGWARSKSVGGKGGEEGEQKKRRLGDGNWRPELPLAIFSLFFWPRLLGAVSVFVCVDVQNWEALYVRSASTWDIDRSVCSMRAWYAWHD